MSVVTLEQRTAVAEALKAVLASAVPSATATVRADGELEVRVPAADLVAAARALAGATPQALNYLSCVSGVDWPERGKLEVVYHVHAMPGAAKASLRVETDRAAAEPTVPSLVEVWPTADLQEREVYDLFGVRFAGHPDLRRVLLSDKFEGHPLRKDFVDNRPERRCVTREDYQA